MSFITATYYVKILSVLKIKVYYLYIE